MRRSRARPGGRRRLPPPFDRLPFPPSQIRALGLASMGSVPEEPGAKPGKYLVRLADATGERETEFSTSVFFGPDRVDLEDACELGNFSSISVRRRRGRFGSREAARVLQEMVDDLTYESGHELQFFQLDAGPEGLEVRLHCDLDHTARRGGSAFRVAFLDLLELCGFEPEVERASRKWLHLRAGPRGARARLLVPVGPVPAGEPPSSASAGKAPIAVVVRPRDGQRENTNGVSYVGLETLLRELHRVRIGSLEMALRRGQGVRRRAKRAGKG